MAGTKKLKKQKIIKKKTRSRASKTCLDSLKSSDALLLKIYAEWCIHCQNMKTEWEKLAESDVMIKELEESKNSKEISSVLKKLKYSEPLGYPTVIFFCL